MSGNGKQVKGKRSTSGADNLSLTTTIFTKIDQQNDEH